MELNKIELELKKNGLVILDNLNSKSWAELNEVILDELGSILNLDYSNSKNKINNLNEKRLAAFRRLNNIPNWEKKYFELGKKYIIKLLGPDLLIQRKLNLSVQLPNDNSSLLGMHADTLSGQSPFEIVLWTAFTDVFETNGMFYFNREISKKIFFEMNEFELEGLDFIREKYWNNVKFLEMKSGQIAIFSGTIFHGNIVNSTSKPRVSINCRFKNLFSPQGASKSIDRSGSIFYKRLQESIITNIGSEYLNREIEF